jgi:hypothetical protein
MPGTRYTVFNPDGESFVPDADRFALQKRQVSQQDWLAQQMLSDRERERQHQRTMAGDQFGYSRTLQGDAIGGQRGIAELTDRGATTRAQLGEDGAFKRTELGELGATERARIQNEPALAGLKLREREYEDQAGVQREINSLRMDAIRGVRGGGGLPGMDGMDDEVRRRMIGGLLGFDAGMTRVEARKERGLDRLEDKLMDERNPERKRAIQAAIDRGDTSVSLPGRTSAYSADQLSQRLGDRVSQFQQQDMDWGLLGGDDDPTDEDNQEIMRMREELAQVLVEEREMDPAAARETANQLIREKLKSGAYDYREDRFADQTASLIQALGL